MTSCASSRNDRPSSLIERGFKSDDYPCVVCIRGFTVILQGSRRLLEYLDTRFAEIAESAPNGGACHGPSRMSVIHPSRLTEGLSRLYL